MSQANPRNVLKIKGSFVKDPTDLTIAFPHGGTALGLAKEIVWEPNIEHFDIIAEEFGGEVTESIALGHVPIIGAVLRGFDNDAISALFPHSSVGASGFQKIEYPGTLRAGRGQADNSFKLLFSPKDTERHNFIIFYNAIPMPDIAASMQLSIDIEFGIAVMFKGIRDGTSRVYAIGRKGDLTL